MADLQNASILRRAQQCYNNKDYAQAQMLGENLLAKNKTDLNTLTLLAYVYRARGLPDKAIAYFEKCIAGDPKNLLYHIELASLFTSLGRFKQAMARLEKAKRHGPDDPRVVAAMADACEKSGNKQEAEELLQPYIAAGTETIAMAYIYAKLKNSAKQPELAVPIMLRHAQEQAFPAGYFFVLGKAYEDLGDVDNAFKAYAHGNALPHAKFNLQDNLDYFSTLIKTFSRQTISRIPRPSHDTARPIFVVGRPRSGTTLLEKIFDAHPQAIGVGEDPTVSDIAVNLGFTIGSVLQYPQCIRDLDQDDVNRVSRMYLDHLAQIDRKAPRTVDKNLTNYMHVGLMQVLWPQAAVINCIRDAVDNCWSCFVADLGSHHGYTTDLRTLGVTYRCYERLMRHWHETLDLRILDVQYENVVADQEAASRSLIDFCGLPWDDRCLRFYEGGKDAKATAAAMTLSYDQVRQPIYKTAVGRARKFDPYLAPLHEGLDEGLAIAEKLGM